MAEDLLVEVGLSEGQYRAALARMEAQTVKSAKKQERSFKASNATISKGFASANTGANVFASHGLRNVSMQLSQVAQQTSASGDWLRALAIQLPDIGLAFGTIGIAAGVAAGAILPLLRNTEDTAEAAKEAKEAVESYMNAVTRMREAVALAGTSLADLTQRYGENAEAAREAAVIQAKIAAADAERDAKSAFATVSAQREEIDSLVLRYDEILLRMEKTRALVDAQEAPSNQLVRIEGERAVLAQQIETITGRTVDEQRELSSLVGDMIDAMDDGTITSEFRSAAEKALELARATGEVDPELSKALDRAIQLELTEAEIKELTDLIAGSAAAVAGNVGLAADQAGRFANEMARAASAMKLQYGVYGSTRSDPLAQQTPEERQISGYEDYYQSRVIGDRLAAGDAAEAARKAAAKTAGGGGGGSGGSSGVNADLREAQQLFEDTRTDAENYAAEIQRIQELHAMGLLDEDTYGRAVDMISEKYGEATEAASAFAEVSNMVGDALIDAAMGGEDAMENLIDALKRAALQAALLGTGPLAALFGGSGGGGILGTISTAIAGSRDGGGYTWDGPRSGGLDGKGGQLMMMHPNETVIDHSKGQSLGGNIVYSPTIDARGADTSAVAKLAEVVARDRMQFTANVQKAIQNSGMRGR